MEDIYDQIENGDLTEDLSMVASLIGMHAVRKLIKEMPGQSFYVPRITRLDSFIARYIDKTKSRNQKEIARELQVSEQYVRNARRRSRERRLGSEK